jgi:proteasome lid subunit RPN8/RPN11
MAHTTGRRASLAQEEIELHLLDDGIEHGYAICQDAHGNTVKGPEAAGTRISVGIEVNCPVGYRATGLFHTHPGGDTEPSPTDIRSARRLGINHLCIGVPETGEVECHDISKRCRRR